MPVTKPSVIPNWASSAAGLAQTVAPAAQDILDGWAPGYRPPAQYFNWLQRQTSNWLTWLQDINNQAFTWTSAQAFSAPVTASAGLTCSALTVSGTTTFAALTVSGASAFAGPASFADQIRADQGSVNVGAMSPGISFGNSFTLEGISSKRSAGGNQFGLDFYTFNNIRMSISNGGIVTIPGGLNSGSHNVTGYIYCTGNFQGNGIMQVAGSYYSTNGNVSCATLKGSGGGLYAPLNLAGGAIGRPSSRYDGDVWIEHVSSDNKDHIFFQSNNTVYQCSVVV